MKKLVVLIMAYNEEQTIGTVLDSIPENIKGIDAIHTIVIDDGSTDKTKEITLTKGATVYSTIINSGVGKAFQLGLEKALEHEADYMINIDADGQFSPEQIPLLLQPLMNDTADFVYGDRFTTQDGTKGKPATMPWAKYHGNIFMSRFISFLSAHEFSDVSSGFRAYSRNAMLMINLTGHFTYTQETFIDLALKNVLIASVPVEVKYFDDRVSKVADNLFFYALKTLKIIIRAFRDYKPFLFFIYLSLPFFIIGGASFIFVLVYFIITGSFSPYKFVWFLSIYLLSLSFFLWIVGFLADMFVRVRINQEKILFMLKNKIYYRNL